MVDADGAAIRHLIAQWRAHAELSDGPYKHALEVCADELEAALASASPATPALLLSHSKGTESARNIPLAQCRDCGTPYGGDDWLDTRLTHAQWNLICPEDGILCANCIVRRAAHLPRVISVVARIEFVEDVERRSQFSDTQEGSIPSASPAAIDASPRRHREPSKVECLACEDRQMNFIAGGFDRNTSDEIYTCDNCGRSVRLLWLGEEGGPYANPEHDPDDCGCENHASWCPYNPHATEVKPYPLQREGSVPLVASPAEPRDGWQAIETAPNEFVLLYRRGYIFVGRVFPSDEQKYKPTHWMPLPPPPSQTPREDA